MTESCGCQAKTFIIYLVGSEEPLKVFEQGRDMIKAVLWQDYSDRLREGRTGSIL